MPGALRRRLSMGVGVLILLGALTLSIYVIVARVVAPDVRHEPPSHIHAMAVSGNRLLAVTHRGVVVIDHGLHEVRVPRRDYTTVAAGADGTLFAARHVSATELREPGVGRRDDGLIRSSDGGGTWANVPLPHRADVHVMAVGRSIYAIDRVDAHLLVSADGTEWVERGRVGPMSDLAASPLDTDLVLGIAADGLWRSADGGRSWRRVRAPSFVAVEWGRAGAWGTTRSGGVWTSTDGYTWAPRGRLPGRAGALVVTDEGLTSVVDETRVYKSSDGRVWQAVYNG